MSPGHNDAMTLTFQFALWEPERIEPWGPATDPELHWFGMSMGEYWIDAGSDRLLEYADGGHVEYQVARFHDDLLTVVATALTPLPPFLIERLVDGSLLATAALLYRATQDLDLDHEVFDALEGIRKRRLDSLYLTPPAEIALWRAGNTMILEWDNRLVPDTAGRHSWSATHGRYEAPVQDFMVRVREFHSRFIAAMAERVRLAQTGWPRPGVRILPGTEDEQVRRTQLLDEYLARPAEADRWTDLLPFLP